MVNSLRIFPIIGVVIFIIIILFAFIYSIPIIFIRRFHQHNNILTLNICLVTILCCLSWLFIHATITIDDPYTTLGKMNFFFYITAMIFTIQVPFSFLAASIHRCCSIVYHTKVFFKTKRWIMLCIGSQWLLGFILSTPDFVRIYLPKGDFLWPKVYALISVMIIPSTIYLITNILIYYHVRSSSRRIQPQTIFHNVQQIKISRRDIYLLRHIILMFCVFVTGWAPTSILPIVNHFTYVNILLYGVSTIWCELALLINIIDLYLYNHKVRKYLKSICLQCCTKF
ncbi:unnamed protein product [Rotaria sp. Silwood2]|nr:unnamed protein product [Rotaria sp. Silwood2]CAF3282372.1 unnamed protein product [Rotaria sp. Silwood2]CAF3542505.1 unnamed protein product [Rotaria sp. Silwood2]CAF4143284.1 unnamed protein product [Rotaria sp. Silwood2]CAF4790485.1 unnamed protein product [Rotaria sp. Silwood2]